MNDTGKFGWEDTASKEQGDSNVVVQAAKSEK